MTIDKIVQPTYVNEFVQIGEGSKIWRFCNVYGTKEHPVIIGDDTQIGSFCEIKPEVFIGNHCRLQSYVFIPEGVLIKDKIFIGPRVTFTNDRYPDIEKTLNGKWNKTYTTVSSGASIGAGVVVNPGAHIGKCAIIGSGAVLIKEVPDYAIVVGNPGRIIGDIRDRKYREQYKELLK